jgi:hypothetical protein
MNHLFFILSPDLDIFWVIKDERGKVIHQGSKENQDEFGMLNINSATGFVYNPLILNKILNVPPGKPKDIEASVPFILEDQILTNLEKFHLVVSDREDIGQVKVALVPEIVMDQINAYILKNEINITSIFNFSNLLHCEPSKGILSILDKYAIINFGDKWSWCSDLESILGLLDKGFKEFDITSFKVYTNKEVDIDWLRYSEIFPEIINKRSQEDYLINPISNKQNNFLQGRYQPKIEWKKYLTLWRYPIAALMLLIVIHFFQLSLKIFQNNLIASELNVKAEGSFYQVFDNTDQNSNFKLALQNKIKETPRLSKNSFLSTFSRISQVINLNENISINSVSFNAEKDLFLLEVELASFEDIDSLKSVLDQSGFEVKVGPQKRSGSSILSEMFITKLQ